jgi:cytochrome c5
MQARAPNANAGSFNASILHHSGMTHSSLIRPTAALFTAVALAACHNGPATTTSAPTTVSTSSTVTATSATTSAPSNAMPSGVNAAMIAMGDSIYHARGCRNCHGMDAKGARNGPDLTSGHFMHVNGSYSVFVRNITTGVPADSIKDKSHTIAMPPRGGGRPAPLTDEQINAVAAYVWSLSHK